MPDTGPFLKAALLCDQVIEGKDGVLTLVRVIDRLIVTAAAAGAGAAIPREMPGMPHQMWLVLMFVSGRARGSEEIEIVMERPDGAADSIFTTTAYFEGEDKGANIVVQLQQEFRAEGLYWFKILLEKEQITRVPFRVIYQRIGPGSQL